MGSRKVQQTDYTGFSSDAERFHQIRMAAYRATHRAAAQLGVTCSMQEPSRLAAWEMEPEQYEAAAAIWRSFEAIGGFGNE